MPVEIRTLRILHLASFSGNIGDLANHAGARRMLANRLCVKLHFTELEIREFYWKQRRFDDAFVDYANGFDLLLIGGGNYFELWVEDSATGTSIDISAVRLARLTVPTVFFSLGVDTGQGYSQLSAQRFSHFMATLLDRPDLFVCVRNDGSRRALCEVLDEKTAASIPIMPDGGFFADHRVDELTGIDSGRIGINIAGDMLERRFSRGLSAERFLQEMADSLRHLMDLCPHLRLDLMPHVWRDSVFIAQLLSMIPDPYVRRRVSVGRMETRESGLADFLQCYRGFDLVLGMRFHANVCPIGMGVPTRGLLSYPQIQHLYEELGMQERLVEVREEGFSNNLVSAVLSDLANLSAQRQACAERLKRINLQAHSTLEMLANWLNMRVL